MSDQPTRIGLLSDVHGNAVALEAVLDDMGDVDAVACAGDIVGYGPSPEQCIETIREREIPTVEGNHERAVVNGQPYESGDRYANRTLSEERLAWLDALPRERVPFDGQLKLVHDHPEERNRYTRPAAFDPALLETEAVLVLGHTHVQHAEVFDEGIVVNPGSVGQPRDRNPDAAYAIVDLDEVTVDLHRVPYDVDEVQQRIADTSIDSHNGRRLMNGRQPGEERADTVIDVRTHLRIRGQWREHPVSDRAAGRDRGHGGSSRRGTRLDGTVVA